MHEDKASVRSQMCHTEEENEKKMTLIESPPGDYVLTVSWGMT